MNNLQSFYQKIDYLRGNGFKMKEIADWIGMAPSVLSSLYTTVLPSYFEAMKSNPPEEALDVALALVNNVSKRRLLTGIDNLLLRLDELEPIDRTNQKESPFVNQFIDEVRLSVSKIEAFQGIYTSYSLSSSSDCLKMEPFIIAPYENQVRVGRLSAYGEAQWGIGISADPQNFHCLFNENLAPQFTMVTVYLQIPFFRNPRQLRGLYIGLDYNRNPIARRILFVKESSRTEIEEFMGMRSGLIAKEDFTPEQQAYYDYTCEAGDFIKMCTVPSLRMDESDLIKEKKMLEL